ncbi:MAG TPA: amidase family protein, partial [Ktedonobacteraceae bacterium]|nr:amidase family protein [Ktedonobacteraceae bacterium]
MHNTPIDPFSSATTMLEALNKRQLSAVELFDLHLQRIERYNPALNAIVTFDFEHALQTAIAADQARSQGNHGALLGLPITIKDTIDVAGLPGTAGAKRHQDRRPEHDAPLVARVRDAGAVIMGKTNVPPYTRDWQADNPVFGRTNNPWDLSRTPGGSTGGGAAALAAGLTPLEFGSDNGGSIRIPAAFCGVFGHKPSDTAVPHNGQFPGSPLPNAATVLFALGPLARDARDLELALDLIAGPAIGDATSWHLQIPPARHEALS